MKRTVLLLPILALSAVFIAACGGAAASTTPTAQSNTVVQSSAVTPAADAQTPEQLCAAAVPAPEPASRSFPQADQVLQSGVDYRAIFCTAVGPVYIDLLEKQTPITVNNFVFLAQKGYFNNTTFHRVIESFMAQGGDPTATGTGGPGYTFADEFVSGLSFDAPGKLAMANSGPNTNGSQFFLTTVPTPHLNQRHTIFGLVIEGQANVEKIQLRDPDTATTPGTALNTVLIVTDPSSVKMATEVPPTEAEVKTAFDRINQIITPDVASILSNAATFQTADEAAAALPEAARSLWSGLFSSHKLQYRASSQISNVSCDLSQVQFMGMGYTLDAYATPSDAAAALADPALGQAILQSGFTSTTTSANLPYPIYTAQIKACDQDAIRALTTWQRGTFVALIEVTLPAASSGAGALDRILTEFVAQQVYEPFLSDVLFKDIR